MALDPQMFVVFSCVRGGDVGDEGGGGDGVGVVVQS